MVSFVNLNYPWYYLLAQSKHPRKKTSLTFPDLSSRYFPTAVAQWVVPSDFLSMAQNWSSFCCAEQLASSAPRHSLHMVGLRADRKNQSILSIKLLWLIRWQIYYSEQKAYTVGTPFDMSHQHMLLFFYFFYFFILLQNTHRMFLQGDMFTTNYLLYKALLITFYTKPYLLLTIHSLLYVQYNTLLTLPTWLLNCLQHTTYNTILHFLKFNIYTYNSAIQFIFFNTLTKKLQLRLAY